MVSVIRRSVLMVAVALCACSTPRAPGVQLSPSTQSASPSTGAAVFFPLAVGNTWTYRDISPQNREARRTVRIVSQDAQGYYLDNARGALRSDAECVRDRVRRLLCTPLTKGKTWSSVVSFATTERYEIAGVNESVEVPAGKFKGCVRVRSQVRAENVERIAEFTYAPGVGLVKLETFAVVDGVAKLQVKGELESYRLAER